MSLEFHYGYDLYWEAIYSWVKFYVSPKLFKRVVWLRGRYELSFGTEDWLEWKHWFKIYRRFITYTIFGYTIGYIIGVFEVRFLRSGFLDELI